MMNRDSENKKCPFFEKDCLKNGCKLYHESFDRCEISLIAYNMFKLANELKSSPKKD